MKSSGFATAAFVLGAILSLTWLPSGVALLAGVALALTFENPLSALTKKLTHPFLSLAVMGLGAGMNLNTVAKAGFQGLGYTFITIAIAFILGGSLGKLLKTNRDTSILLTVGTAICGGSAIAAVSPVLRAKSQDVSVALGIVFLLNAVALILFPYLGHAFQLNETQFGLWCALAIHDTSSVVGATLQYGAHAVEVGTTVKLARALWIVPITFLVAWAFTSSQDASKNTNSTENSPKPKRPWFILGFLIMAAFVTWIPTLQTAGHWIEAGARHLLVLTLFLIGTNLTRETLKAVGFKPFLQGALLWLVMGGSTLFAVYHHWIS